jgi:hypothetical protein
LIGTDTDPDSGSGKMMQIRSDPDPQHRDQGILPSYCSPLSSPLPISKTVGSAPTGATRGPQEAEPFLCCTFVSPDESLYHNISGTPTYNGGGGGAYADRSVENATDSNKFSVADP